MELMDALEITARGIAHHEAGHAVTFWLGARRLGTSIPNAGLISITIPTVSYLNVIQDRGMRGEPLTGFSGMTEYDEEAFIKANGKNSASAQVLAVSALAGLVAEHRFLRKFRAVPGLVDYLSQTKEDRRLSLEECKAEIIAGRSLLDVDRMRWYCSFTPYDTKLILKKTREYIHLPRAWRAIEALADRLSNRHEIAGEEAAKIIQTAWGG